MRVIDEIFGKYFLRNFSKSFCFDESLLSRCHSLSLEQESKEQESKSEDFESDFSECVKS